MIPNAPDPRRFIISLDDRGEVLRCVPKDGKFRPCPPGHNPQIIMVVTADVESRT
ncbi:hypothetical protein [Komagataeibacter sp. FNDCF1]|uniref:hypothetical protein n=1 Tax=Komagataeibacter sp. FNDCF1 TaxID=2878681 RepID=UPI001E51BA59|nr:hypothetical protein [Komagataeibacter sp. FNDCF1]MCE2563348.1 hypothetical protein [Komagataeibacter sp. FNDCF1]